MSAALVLKGARVTLRPPRERDKAERLSYGRDPEATRMYGGDPHMTPPLTAEDVERWYARWSADPLAWVIEAEGRCIGNARLHHLDRENRRARYAVGIFDPACWNKGYGTETTRLVLQYAFEELRLHRVELLVLEFNHRAIACYEKCGFVREGIEREGALVAGEWHGDVRMSILEDEYRAVSATWPVMNVPEPRKDWLAGR